jgi:rhodanese-related sulfurtransferase
VILSITVLIGAAAACGGGQDSGQEPRPAIGQKVDTPEGSYIDISAQELAGMLEEKDFRFINVHVPYEGEIQPTDHFVPFDEVEERIDAFPSEKDAKIALYCRSGSMSATAARELVRLGYTNVWNLSDGMLGWADAGYPVVETQ